MTKFTTLLLAIPLLLTTAQAGGLAFSELGTTSSIATAGNYNETGLRDASAAYANPAAMAFMENSKLTLGLEVIDYHLHFNSDIGNNSDGSSTTPAPVLHYVHKLDNDWAWGIAMASTFGSGIDYKDDWAGRYYLNDIILSGFTMHFSLGKKVTDKLAIGGSLVVCYLNYDLETSTPRGPAQPDGEIEYSDDDLQLGYKLSLMYKFTPKTRLGITYHSQIKHSFNDSVRFSPDLPIVTPPILENIDVDMTIPQMLRVGLHHQINDKLAILVSGSWEDWSRFGEIGVQTRAGENDVNRKYDDTLSAGIGFEYQLNDEWLLLSGIRYDSSTVSDNTRTVDLPSDRAWRIGVGAEYRLNESATIGMAYEYVDLGDPAIALDPRGDVDGDGSRPDAVTGEYDKNYLNFFVISLNLDL